MNDNRYLSYKIEMDFGTLIDDYVATAIKNIDAILLDELKDKLAEYGYVKRDIVNAFETGKCLDGTNCPAWRCSHCGNLFEANGKYCTWCGSEIEKCISICIATKRL